MAMLHDAPKFETTVRALEVGVAFVSPKNHADTLPLHKSGAFESKAQKMIESPPVQLATGLVFARRRVNQVAILETDRDLGNVRLSPALIRILLVAEIIPLRTHAVVYTKGRSSAAYQWVGLPALSITIKGLRT